jgi:hypothetical protein
MNKITKIEDNIPIDNRRLNENKKYLDDKIPDNSKLYSNGSRDGMLLLFRTCLE